MLNVLCSMPQDATPISTQPINRTSIMTFGFAGGNIGCRAAATEEVANEAGQ